MTLTFTVLFEPLDVLVFKDHRPFDAGHHSAGGSRWPLPSAFFGALRTALMLDAQADFSRSSFPHFKLSDEVRGWLGDGNSPGTLRLRGPLLVRRVGADIQPFFPSPFYVDEPLRIPSALRFPGADQPPALPWPKNPADKAKGKHEARVLTKEGLECWMDTGSRSELLGESPESSSHWKKRDELVRVEARTGIAREETRTVKEGLLYTISTWRFRDGVALGVELDAEDIAVDAIRRLHRRIVPLGGKGHRAQIHVFSQRLIPEPPTASEKRACALFLTPLVLSGLADGPTATGNKESSPTASSLEGLVPHPGARLHTLRTDRNELPHGGWNLAQGGRRRPLTPLLPAGTVAYLNDTDAQQLAQATWGQTPHLYQAGFGTTVYGNW